jgi:hypothetical protein
MYGSHPAANRPGNKSVATGILRRSRPRWGDRTKAGARPGVPDPDDALGLASGLGRAASRARSWSLSTARWLISPDEGIMRSCRYRSSYHYQRSALPTFAYYSRAACGTDAWPSLSYSTMVRRCGPCATCASSLLHCPSETGSTASGRPLRVASLTQRAPAGPRLSPSLRSNCVTRW